MGRRDVHICPPSGLGASKGRAWVLFSFGSKSGESLPQGLGSSPALPSDQLSLQGCAPFSSSSAPGLGAEHGPGTLGDLD